MWPAEQNGQRKKKIKQRRPSESSSLKGKIHQQAQADEILVTYFVLQPTLTPREIKPFSSFSTFAWAGLPIYRLEGAVSHIDMRPNTFRLKQDQLRPIAQPSYVEKHASSFFCNRGLKKKQWTGNTFAHILAFLEMVKPDNSTRLT